MSKTGDAMIEELRELPENQSEVCTCSICGYEWSHGQDGLHCCTDALLRRIAELESRNDVIFLESPCQLSEAQVSGVRKMWHDVFGKSRTAIILEDGLQLANQQEWRPATLDIQCGNITITNDGASRRGRGTVIKVDGVEMPNVRRISLDLTCDAPLAVKIELQAKPNATSPKTP